MKHPMEHHCVFQIDFLSELADETYSDLFLVDFPSLSDFDDTYTCGACTDAQDCSVYVEIEFALQVDITYGSSIDFSIDTHIFTFLTDEALNISATRNKSSIKNQPSLELKPFPKDLKYSSKLELE